MINAAALALFVIAYGFVFLEEKLHLRKSKPVLVAGGLIWILVALAVPDAPELLRHTLLEYAELFLFLLSAMTFIGALVERRVFDALRRALTARNFSLRQLYWVTGTLAFFLSPVADNLTTAMVMGTVAVALGAGAPRFVAAACVNIVVAANAGGAFSPFGDITTLMVWQKGVVPFFDFFSLFLPALASWLVPAALIGLTVPKARPQAAEGGGAIKKGGIVIALLFLATIAATVLLHHALHLPPFLGMLLGLGILKVYGYAIRKDGIDTFETLREIEWDTLLFFLGIMLCVGALGALGQLAALSHWLYGGLGATGANALIGILSAAIDNIPLTFAVLSMEPDMGLKQWLLLTLTAGTGGSLLSVGSAAGVALMGVAKGHYTFMSHLKRAWAIALGYAAGISVHLLLN